MEVVCGQRYLVSASGRCALGSLMNYSMRVGLGVRLEKYFGDDVPHAQLPHAQNPLRRQTICPDQRLCYGYVFTSGKTGSLCHRLKSSPWETNSITMYKFLFDCQ